MRDIKFKAWDKKNKKMCPVWDIGWKTWDDDGEINYVKVEGDGTYDLLEDEVELLRFTGLYDRNGKEIYEGDVVEYSSYYIGDHRYDKGINKVYWDDGCFFIENVMELNTPTITNLGVRVVGNKWEGER